MSIPPSTYPAQFVFCGTAFRGKRAPKALKKHFGIDMAPFDAKTPWHIPVDELPPLLSESPPRRWVNYKESNSEADSSNSVPILPSTRFLASGKEMNNAPWVNWGTDIVAVCVFLEDRVTTAKRLQQSLPPFSQLPHHSRIVVVGFRLQKQQAADLGLTVCDMRWEEANKLMSRTHPSISYFAQIETALQRPEDKLYQLFAWLVARRITQLPTKVDEDLGKVECQIL